MKKYSTVILTNIPSFYKINLYNKINEKKRLFVLFTGDSASNRNKDFFNKRMDFDFENLEHLKRFAKLSKIYNLINSCIYNELIICGVNELSSWLCAFCFPKTKNSTVVESSYNESKVTGLKGILKKLFFKRITKTYASGKAQEQLVKLLNFKGQIVITKGVGIFNFIAQPPYKPSLQVKNFLYVGRLSSEKNLVFLINVFNKFPEYRLNIVGYGPLELELKNIAKDNIVFYGAIDNCKLPQIYQSNDVLVLPSLSEPWGLVVEEALNNGLPVLISSKVGCAEEIIQEGINGLIFVSNNEQSLIHSIYQISELDRYNYLKLNVSRMKFQEIEDYQVNCYL